MKKALLSLLILFCGMTASMAQEDSDIDREGNFYLVGTLKQFKEAMQKEYEPDDGVTYTWVKLTDDIYLSDLPEQTFASNFHGKIDGNGHTIYGARPEVQHDGGGHYKRTYLFTHVRGAEIFNVTFKDIRVESSDHDNQGIIASTAEWLTLDNVTFDNVSIFCDDSYVGAIAGSSDHCKFNNVTVKNSDFTVDSRYVGGLSGYSEKSTFTNCFVDDHTCICSDGNGSTAYAGGIVGRSLTTTFNNCVNYGFVAGDNNSIGGIVGYTDADNHIINCLNAGMVISLAQKYVTAFYESYMYFMPFVVKKYNGRDYWVRKLTSEMITYIGGDPVGGIVGYAYPDVQTGGDWGNEIKNCANIGSLYTNSRMGGIATYGYQNHAVIDGCYSDFVGGGTGDIFAILSYKEEIRCYEKPTVKNCFTVTDYKLYTIPPGIDVFYSDDTKHNFVPGNGEYSTHWKYISRDKFTTLEFLNDLGDNWELNLGYDSNPLPTGTRKLHHTRQVSNKYGTICLPFGATSNEDVSFYQLNAIKIDEEGYTTKLYFSYVSEIEPGQPAIFRTTKSEISIVDPRTEYLWELPEIYIPTTPGLPFWILEGTFEQKVFTGDDAAYIYYLSNDKIRNAKTTTISPYRAFFHGPRVKVDAFTNEPLGKAMNVQFFLEDEDNVTEILEMVDDEFKPIVNGKTYTIMGTEVDDNYRGLIIKNGKKIYRK